MKQRLVVVGGGMAALRLVEELVQLCPGRYDIVLVAKEPRGPYNRVLLSSLLAGDVGEADIELRPASWFTEHGVRVVTGAEVAALHPERREIVLADGTTEPYDRLVLATGSKALKLPVPGHDLPGVLTFRDLDDVGRMQEAAPGTHGVVIGGGLLGVEAACGLAKRGLHVTLLHIMPRLMERQLDDTAGKLLQKSLEERGLKFLIGAQTQALIGNAGTGRTGAQATPMGRVRAVHPRGRHRRRA